MPKAPSTMVFPISEVMALALQCAPTVAPETMLSIIKVESGFNPLAIGVNGAPQVRVRATSKATAAAHAEALIGRGRNIDLGLAQINSANFGWLGMSPASALDPCRNLSAAERILSEGYRRARAKQSDPQAALRTALSYYNTGHARRGFENGYVAKVEDAARRLVPALRAGPAALPPHPSATDIAPPTPAASWDVFARSEGDVFDRTRSERAPRSAQ